jgi:hypothetical protein
LALTQEAIKMMVGCADMWRRSFSSFLAPKASECRRVRLGILASLLSALAFASCGDGGGSKPPAARPVLGVGSFVGTFADDAGTVAGSLGVVASPDGRINLHLARTDAAMPFFEANAAGALVEGTVLFQPILAIASHGLLTDVSANLGGGRIDATVSIREQGQPPDRTLRIEGALGSAGGSGTFEATTPAGITRGSWSLAPGVLPDAAPPADAAVDAGAQDAAIDAPADAPAALDAEED